MRVEAIKLFKRRMFWVMLIILLAVTGMVALVLLYLPTIAPDEFEGFPTITKPDAYAVGASQVIGQTWFPAILAVVMLGGELSTTVWAGALTMESRRWLHLLAKTVVITVAATVAAVIAIAGWSLFTLLFVEGSGGPDPAEWTGILAKTALTQLTWVAIALGGTGLFRAIGPAIGVVLAFTFGEGILALWKPWQRVSLSSASTRLIADLGDLTGGFGVSFTGEMSFRQALVVVIAWTMLGIALAIVGLQVRDP
jgi:hypothetical protein